MKTKIPMMTRMHSLADDPSPLQFRELEYEIRKRDQHLTIDRVTIEQVPHRNFAVDIAARFVEAVNTDRVKKDTQSAVTFTPVPKGIRAAILCRMFGDDGEEAPKWWPEWLRAKVKPRMKEIMTSHHSKTEIHYQRVCPHQGEQGHAAFMFGPELALADRGMKNDLYAAAERSRGDEFFSKICDLIRACQMNNYEPTLLSLGAKEMSMLVRSQQFREMRDFHGERIEPPIQEFMGLKIEEVKRDTYLSIC